MSPNQLIIETVTPIVPVCVPDLYVTEPGERSAEVYCTFNFTVLPEGEGNDTCTMGRALVQVHLFTPRRMQTVALRRRLWAALAAQPDFSLPEIENASDADGQHYVFEFDALGDWLGGEDDG